MTSDILIRTYAKDAEWLGYCLKSLQKFADGFRRLILICPEDSSDVISPMAKEYGCEFLVCDKLHETDDYVGQMATKMFYDEITDADVIHHVDSDMVFSSTYYASSMIGKDGKVIIGKQEYAQLSIHWKPIVEKLVGFEVTWEYNRIFPSAYPRWLYASTRNHLTGVANIPFRKLIAEVKDREFSECNVLGAVAEKFYADKFDFRDITRDELPARPCACYWSWGGITPEIKARIERALA